MSFHFLFRWCKIKAQPGANRLINHLRSNGVPMALASNSPRENIETKISYHQGNFCIWILKNKEANISGLILINMFHWQYGHTHLCIYTFLLLFFTFPVFFWLWFLRIWFTLTGWKQSFSVIIGGDEVKSGKPSPEM